MVNKTVLIICTISLLSACSGAQPPSPTPTPEATFTPTQMPPTNTPQPTPTDTPVPPTPTPEPLYQVPSFSCPGALPSRLGLGVIAQVVYATGEALRIRTSPRITDSNIFDLVGEGSYVDIIAGPECVAGADGAVYIFWQIRDREANISGWTAESSSDSYFLRYDHPPRPLRGNQQSIDAYNQALGIMLDTDLRMSEKRAQLRLVQRTYGEEVLQRVIEYLPVYDDDDRYFENFDAYVRAFVSPYGSWSSDSPFETDPAAAGLSIFFDPSEENIAANLGLD